LRKRRWRNKKRRGEEREIHGFRKQICGDRVCKIFLQNLGKLGVGSWNGHTSCSYCYSICSRVIM
jgi:hypothetical protein